MSYIIVGAGGHAKVVLDILNTLHENIAGIIDDNFRKESFKGLPVLGTTSELDSIVPRFPQDSFIVAVGNYRPRKQIVNLLETFQVNFGTAIHPSAIIGSGVTIGKGTVVMPNVIVNADSHVGDHVILNTACTVDHDCSLQNFVHISPGAHLAGGVKIGECTHIGIGSNVIPRKTIGKFTTVGAGACVVADIPDYVLAVGCPAKVIRTIT